MWDDNMREGINRIYCSLQLQLIKDMAQPYGPTAELHEQVMHVLWGPLMNFSIIMAIYSYRKYAIILHSLVSAFVSIFSLALSLQILATTGFPDSSFQLYSHYCVGFLSMLLIILQVLLGITIKVLNIFDQSSNLIHKLSLLHKIVGYGTTIFCKASYYIKIQPEEHPDIFFGFLAMDIIVVVIIIVRKVIFPKLEKYPASDLTAIEGCLSVKSLKEVSSGRQHIIFNNYVYDIDALGSFHPAGMEVIRSVVNRDVDRYLYGMYSSEKHPQLGAHSHSYRSLKLLDAPVAKLDIIQTCPDMKAEFQVAVSSYACLSQSSQLYELKLRCLQGTAIFQGYCDASQLGRFRSLMLNDSVTRLYTNVYFTLSANTKLMEEIFPGELTYLQDHIKNKGNNQEFTEVSMEDLSENPSQRTENVVPIVFKRYPQGKLTNELAEKMMTNQSMLLSLSCEKGLGLQLKELTPGRVLILAGGTGLLPFSDLIDLVFKEEYALDKPALKKRFCEVSPILSAPFLEKITFTIFAAFHSLQDIHKITLLQLAYLATNTKRMRVTLKLSQVLSEETQKKLGFGFVSERFQELLERELRGEEPLAKVWVCGPPKMNEGMTTFLSSRIAQSLFSIL